MTSLWFTCGRLLAGESTLTGHAASASDVNKIVEAARSVSGVKRVVNKIHVQ